MGMLGGWTSVNLNDKKSLKNVRKIASFATDFLNQEENSLFRKKMTDIISAKTQVVSGTNYNITMRLGETKCTKNGPTKEKNVEDCELMDKHKDFICDVTVYYQSWRNVRKVTAHECHQEIYVMKRSVKHKKIFGGLHQMKKKSGEVKRVIAFATDKLNEKHLKPMRAVLTLKDVTYQMVRGKKYFLTVHIEESSCKNSVHNKGKTAKKCPPVLKPTLEECQISVVHMASETPEYELLDDIRCTMKSNPRYYQHKYPNLYYKSSHKAMKHSHNMVIKMFGGDDHDIANWGVFAQFVKTYNKTYKSREGRIQHL